MRFPEQMGLALQLGLRKRVDTDGLCITPLESKPDSPRDIYVAVKSEIPWSIIILRALESKHQSYLSLRFECRNVMHGDIDGGIVNETKGRSAGSTVTTVVFLSTPARGLRLNKNASSEVAHRLTASLEFFWSRWCRRTRKTCQWTRLT